MTYLLIVLAASALFAAYSLALTHVDGRGSTPPPSSHFTDPAFLPPSSRNGQRPVA